MQALANSDSSRRCLFCGLSRPHRLLRASAWVLAAAECVLFFAAPASAAQSPMTIACSASESSGEYCVAISRREITPTSPVYLGGYGFGPERKSTGVKKPDLARAIAISRGDRTSSFARSTRKAISSHARSLLRITGPQISSHDAAIPESAIIIASIHDHSEPDDIGVWGGLPPD